jgi:hypothetical protein
MKNLAAEVGVDINSFAPTASQQAWPVLAQVIRHCFERRGEEGMKLAGVKMVKEEKRGMADGNRDSEAGAAGAPASDLWPQSQWCIKRWRCATGEGATLDHGGGLRALVPSDLIRNLSSTSSLDHMWEGRIYIGGGRYTSGPTRLHPEDRMAAVETRIQHPRRVSRTDP